MAPDAGPFHPWFAGAPRLHCSLSLGPSCASSRFEPESLLLAGILVIGVWHMAHRASGFSFLDVVDSSLWSDLSSDAQEFEAESWSLVVDPSFCSRQEKDVIKRQDVIFGKHLNLPWGRKYWVWRTEHGR